MTNRPPSDRRSTVRQVIKTYGRLAKGIETLSDDADLYQAGMTSHASVNVMLGLESAFEIEFPDQLLTRKVFESVNSITQAVEGLLERASAV